MSLIYDKTTDAIFHKIKILLYGNSNGKLKSEYQNLLRTILKFPIVKNKKKKVFDPIHLDDLNHPVLR